MQEQHKDKLRRREFLKDGAVAAVGFGCLSGVLGDVLRVSGQKAKKPKKIDTNHPQSVHNMLLFGLETAYLSHFPLFSFPGFDSPHNFQVILEIDLGESQAAYASDRRNYPETKIYTFSPEKFVLKNLLPPTSLSAFSGTIFRDHLEKRGKPIKDAQATVKKILCFREFNTKASRPTRLEYLVFGKGPETFMAHLITKPPDFDQILSVKIPNGVFSDEDLSKGEQIVIPRKNVASQRLRSKQSVMGSEKGSFASPFKLGVLGEDYFEEGELLVPPEFATTREEKTAGFP
jgi:hypothetical protein